MKDTNDWENWRSHHINNGQNQATQKPDLLLLVILLLLCRPKTLKLQKPTMSIIGFQMKFILTPILENPDQKNHRQAPKNRKKLWKWESVETLEIQNLEIKKLEYWIELETTWIVRQIKPHKRYKFKNLECGSEWELGKGNETHMNPLIEEWFPFLSTPQNLGLWTLFITWGNILRLAFQDNSNCTNKNNN